MPRLNRARSRLRCSSWSRTRIAHTSFGLRGRFWPIRRLLFHEVRAKQGRGWLPLSMIVSSEANPDAFSRSLEVRCDVRANALSDDLRRRG